MGEIASPGRETRKIEVIPTTAPVIPTPAEPSIPTPAKEPEREPVPI